MKHVDYKVPGGKMIRMDVSVLDGSISSIRITGDFFMHPEAAIVDLEKFLIGKDLSDRTVINLERFLQSRHIRLVGLSPQDIMDAILKAF